MSDTVATIRESRRVPASIVPAVLRVATYNVENAFALTPEPGRLHEPPSAQEYRTKIAKLALAISGTLGSPDVIGFQEVQNAKVLRDVFAQPSLRDAGYRVVVRDSDDPRGINNGFAYRPDRVTVNAVHQPDPVWRPATLPAGYVSSALFARAPLVIDATVHLGVASPASTAAFSDAAAGVAALGAGPIHAPSGPADAVTASRRVQFVVNHLRSKIGGPAYDARREAQTAYLARMVDHNRALDPATPVVLMGDFNAAQGEPAIDQLTMHPDGAVRLVDATAHVPAALRYTEVYRGAQNLLDHLFVTPGAGMHVAGASITHINADAARAEATDPATPARSSDHDPILATLHFTPIPNAG